MCTSLAPGFYLKDRESFGLWRDQLKHLQALHKDSCIFSVFDRKPQYMLDLDASDRLVPATGANRVKIGLNNVVQPSRPNSDSNSSSFDDLGDF